MTDEQREICRIVGQVLRGEDADCHSLSFDKFIAYAQSCDALNILYPLVKPFLSDSIRQVGEIMMMQYALNEENVEFEFNRICKSAEEKGLFILALKGIYTKNLYPEPIYRQLGDIDLLYNSTQHHEIAKMMKSLGFNDTKYTMQHTKWYNPVSGVTVEMHNSLYNEEGIDKSFYSDLLNRIVPINKYKNIYRMSDTDNYVYTLIHLYRHYRQRSATMKQVCDLYVMQLYSNLSYEKIEKEIRLLNAEDFYIRIVKLIDKLYISGEMLTDEEEYMADVILGKRFYKKESVQGSRFKRILKMLFPSPKKIYVYYPYIYKHKWLLPVGYVLRIFRCLKSDNTFVFEKIK